MSIFNSKINSFLDKDTSVSIKGIAAFSVMMGHLSSSLPWYISHLFPGGLWVAVFFFYSGYGLHLGLLRDPEQKGFLMKKFYRVLLPFIIAEVLYWTVCPDMNIADLLKGIFCLKLLNPVLWYVVELLVMLAIFYVLNKILKHNYHRYCVAIHLALWLVFMLLSVIFDIGVWWYISTSAYLIGITFALKKDKVLSITNREYMLFACSVIFTSLYACLIMLNTNVIALNHLKNYAVVLINIISAPFFLAFVAFITHIISENNRGKRSKLLAIMGGVSYEIYLFHMPIYIVSKQAFDNNYTIVFTVIITIFFSVLFSKVYKLLR